MSTKNQCCGGNPSCNLGKDSIYTGKTDSGKGDKPRKVSKSYEENYNSIFPNAFKPRWQIEIEQQKHTESTSNE